MEAKDALDSPGEDSNGFVDLGSILGGDRWTYVNDDLTASTGSNSSASGAIPGRASPSHDFLHATGGDAHVTNPHSGVNAQNPVSSTTGKPTSGSSGGVSSSSNSSSNRWDGGLFRMDGRSSVFSAAPWRGVTESAAEVGFRGLSHSVSFAFDAAGAGAGAGTGMASAVPGSSHGRAGAWNVYNRLGSSVADGMDFPGQIGTARAGSSGRINEIDTLLNGGAGYAGAVGGAGVVAGSSISTGVSGSRGGGGVGSGARCVSPWCSSVRDSLPFLLPTEQVVLEEPNTLLVNTDTTGHLLLTSLRILFLSASPSPAVHPSPTIPASPPCALSPHPLGSVYFPVIDRVAKLPPGRLANSRDHLLQVHTKDARVLVYALPPRICAQAPPVFDTIIHLLPRSLLELPVFHAPLAALATPTASTSRSGSSSNSSSAGSIEEGALSPTAQDSHGAGASTPPRAFTPPLPSPPAAAAAAAAAAATAVAATAGGASMQAVGVVTAECMRVLAMLPEHWRRLWEISRVNAAYAACSSYPQRLLLPSCISDDDAMASAAFRARGRFPVMCWQHPGNGAVLSRAAQPLVGILSSNRSDADERLVAALAGPALPGDSFRRLVVADARPRKNAIANGAMGGGYESSANYRGTEVVYLGIDNIHAVRDSMNRLREYLDTHGSACSDGSSSLLRSGTGGWTGGSVSGTSQVVAALVDSCWLQHCHSLLSGAVFIAAQIALQGNSVLVHCSDGWDRTPSLVSLAMLLLDPYYRTFQGFQSLVETHWAAFGHPFADRLGVPAEPPTASSSSSRTNPALSLAAAAAASPGAIAGGVASGFPVASSSVAGSTFQANSSNNQSPVFFQWIDAVAQLLRLFPRAFEFSTAFLVDLLDSVLSCRFANFLCNNDKERSLARTYHSSIRPHAFPLSHANHSPASVPPLCVWEHLRRLRDPSSPSSLSSSSTAAAAGDAGRGRQMGASGEPAAAPCCPLSHPHVNPLYSPSSIFAATAPPASAALPAAPAAPAAAAATAAVCTATSSTSCSTSTCTQAAIRPASCPPVQIRHMALFPPSPPSPAILLPPAASLAPVLLPELYLRWCCPAAVPPLRSLLSSSSPLASLPPPVAAAATAAATRGGGAGKIRRLYHSHRLIEAECAALQGAVEKSQLGMQQLQEALQESESRRAEAERRRDEAERENASLRRNLANLQQSQEAMLAAVCQEAASAAAAAAFTAAGAGGSAASASAAAAVRSCMAASSRFPSLASAATAAAAAAAAAAAGGLRLALPTGARRSRSVSSEPRSSGAAPDASGASGAAADSIEASAISTHNYAVGLGEALHLDTGRSNGTGGGATSPAPTTPPFLPLHAASWSPCFGSGGAAPTCPSCARPLMVVAAGENELEEGGAEWKAGGRIGGLRGEGIEENSAAAREDGEWEEAIEGWQYECLWCGLSASGCRKTSGSWTAAAEVDNGEVGESGVKGLKKLLEQQGQQHHQWQLTVSEAADAKPYAGGNRGSSSGTAGSASNCQSAVCSMPVPAFVRADFDALRCGPIPNYVGSLSSSSSHSAGAAAM
ncbi:unnamed protein product [Closterium sp. NIES-65]|nr:unnamed protein product [Closterium sp. NIES-65]